MRLSVIFCVALVGMHVGTVCSVLPTVFIVMSVKTKKLIVKRCVASVLRHQSGSVRQRLIFVDDGSPKETIAFEKQLCDNQSLTFTCLTNRAKGYTNAIHYGIETALAFSTEPDDAIILLNSDVIVTHGWLFTLYQALMYDNETMLIGPVSNAGARFILFATPSYIHVLSFVSFSYKSCDIFLHIIFYVILYIAATYQSVPEVNTGKGCCHWVTNPFPPGLDLDTLSNAARNTADELQLTRVPIIVLNGFSYMFKKTLIDAIGSFDKVNFPLGYGEEVDFSLRAYKAGFKAYVVPAVYLYHEKTASFTENSKKTLKKSANPTLRLKYAEELDIANALVQSTTSKQLQTFRKRMNAVYHTPLFQNFQNIHSYSVMFLFDVKSAQSDILRSQLYHINALISIGMKVTIGIDKDGKNLLLKNIRFLNLDAKKLRKAIYFHPDNTANTEFLTSMTFMKTVESQDIIIGHSCNIVFKLVKLFPNLPKHMIVYQMNDFNMQKVDQFNNKYHTNKMDSCTKKLTEAKNNVLIVANTESNAKLFNNIYQPSLPVMSGGLTLDQNVYFMDDLVMHSRLQHLRSKDKTTAGGTGNTRTRHITFYFSTASFSLHETAEFILNVAYALIKKDGMFTQVTVAHFGTVDTATAFVEHLALKKTFNTMHKLKYLQDSNQFHYFGGNDLKYGNLLRKTHLFVDMTHGHFSEQRVLEAMLCGALVLTSTASPREEFIQLLISNKQKDSSEMLVGVDYLYYEDTLINVTDTVTLITNILATSSDVYEDIIRRYISLGMEYKLERKAVEWAVRTNEQFIAYRANHISTSVSIAL